MYHRNAILAVVVLAACSSRANNFGGPEDAGDIGADAPHDADVAMLGMVGQVCNRPNDCVDGALCIGTAGGEYLCMQVCDLPYSLCSDGEVCLPVMTQDTAICYRGGAASTAESCENNLDCGTGLLCFGAVDEFYCRPACAEEADCAGAQMCQRLDSGAGLCRGSVGAGCFSGGDCFGSLGCSEDFGELAGRFLGGYCTTPCARDADCPSNSVCRTISGVAQGTCLAQCDHRSECRFTGDYDCLDAGACSASADPTACQAMFGEDSLCVPGPF